MDKTVLALTRKPGQGIKVGDDILVEVKSVAGNNVRIRIHAPRDVNISRCTMGDEDDD